jgi:hypothetical protein
MQIMANDNIGLRKEECICVFLEGTSDFLEITGAGDVLLHKETSDEGRLPKGVYVLEPAINHPHDGLVQKS